MSLVTATQTERDYIQMCVDHFKIIYDNIPTSTGQMNTIVNNLKAKKLTVDSDNGLLNANMMSIVAATWT